MHHLLTFINCQFLRILGKSSPKSKHLWSTVYYKMLRNNLTQILNIVLIISCFVHVLFIFYNNSNPANPEIIIENKNIMDISMPLSFIFCLRNMKEVNESRNEMYQRAGYENPIKFFSGTSRHNESVVGWLGHMENGSTYNSMEGRFSILSLYGT